MPINKLPTREECFKLLDSYGTAEERFKQVKEHSIIVSKTAVFLAKKLKDAGEKVNVELVEKAALLHDIEKVSSIKDPKRNHAIDGEKTLVKEGYPEIGVIVGKHLQQTFDECKTWEEKLIMYSDARAVKDKVTSLKEKEKYLLIRYKGIYPISRIIKESAQKLRTLEKEIFSKIGLKPEDLPKLVKIK